MTSLVVVALVVVGLAAAWAAEQRSARGVTTTLDCVGGPVPLGGVARVRLRVTPSRRVRFSIHRTRARLISIERPFSDEVAPDVLYEERLPLSIPVPLSGPFEHEWAIRLSPEVPPSWKGKFGELVTAVEVDLPFAELGGTSARVEVQVLPELARD